MVLFLSALNDQLHNLRSQIYDLQNLILGSRATSEVSYQPKGCRRVHDPRRNGGLGKYEILG